MSIHSQPPIIRSLSVILKNTLFSIHKPKRLLNFLRDVLRRPLVYEATLAYDRVPAETFAKLFPQFESCHVELRRGQVDRHGWNVKLHEEILLGQIALTTKAMTIFEIGTFDGGTTRRLAEDSLPGAVVYTIDLPEDRFDATQGPEAFSGSRVGEKYRNSAMASKVKQIRADTSTFDFSSFYEKIDFVFVDAAHDYPHGLKDSINAIHIVRPGGVVVWHDFEPYWSGLVHAVCEATAGLPLKRIAGTSMAVLRKPASL